MFEPKTVVIPAGKFMMGSPADEEGRWDDEGPVHEVKVEKFALGKYPVTFKKYDCFCDATGRDKPSDNGWGRGNRPVINVSWNDAATYCQWLSKETGRSYRLPTEAEWEYACRAGSQGAYYFGDDVERLKDYAWHGDNSAHQTHPVGKKRPNAWGLYDMYGNVWEWCEDHWHWDYQGAPTNGSAWTDGSEDRRVLRGGSWYSLPSWVRSAYRFTWRPTIRTYYIGFRVAKIF